MLHICIGAGERSETSAVSRRIGLGRAREEEAKGRSGE